MYLSIRNHTLKLLVVLLTTLGFGAQAQKKSEITAFHKQTAFTASYNSNYSNLKLHFTNIFMLAPTQKGGGEMEIRFANGINETKQMDTYQLRSNFLFSDLFVPDQIKLVYSHYDRVIIGGIQPVNKTVELPNHPELRADYFLERRELGVINLGGDGIVMADGKEFVLRKMDCV